MTDEEKKAIEDIKRIIFNNEYDFIILKDSEGFTMWNNTFEIILYLIKKQSEEIEELKEDNKHQWEERCKLTFELENSTRKDKIKAKIEELEKEQEDNRKSLYNAINNLCLKEVDKISYRISVNMSVRDILQSLLEEE